MDLEALEVLVLEGKKRHVYIQTEDGKPIASMILKRRSSKRVVEYAHLLAAAPQLYLACRRAVEHLATMPDTMEAMIMCREATDSAEGPRNKA